MGINTFVVWIEGVFVTCYVSQRGTEFGCGRRNIAATIWCGTIKSLTVVFQFNAAQNIVNLKCVCYLR
jgi:hypothetical protein